MKGKRLLILGAAFALGLSACASAVTIARHNPLKAAGATPSGSWEPIQSPSEINTTDDFLLAYVGSQYTYYGMGTVGSSALQVTNTFANAKTVQFESTTGGYFIKIASSYYINNASSTGISRANSGSSVWVINEDDLCVENTSNSNRFLGGASDGGNIKAYASGNKGTYPNVHVYKKVTTISLDKTELAIIVGSTSQLIATLDPAGAGTIVWSSSNASVATVDQTGLVTAVAAGTATITAKISDSIKATCTVFVSSGSVHAESITLNKESLSLYTDDTETLIATVSPENSTDTVVWSSSNTSVATVDQTGLVTGLAIGNAVITVTAGSKSASCSVSVSIEPGTIESDPLTVAEAIAIGNRIGAGNSTAKEYYINGIISQIDENNFGGSYNNATFWLYNGETVKGFEGYRLKLADGLDPNNFKVGAEVTIHAKIKNYGGTIENNGGIVSYLAFTTIPTTSVTLNKNSLNLEVDGEEALVATIAPANSTDEITWSSSDEDVATVNQNGFVTAVGVGQATIIVASGNYSATCAVTVSASTQTTIVITDQNLLGYNGTNIAYSSEIKNVTIDGMLISSFGCAAYGDGIQMRTNNTSGVSTIYNTNAASIKMVKFVWAASKDVTTGKDYHLFVEFSDKTDFSELIGEKQQIKIDEGTKLGEAIPTSAAKFFRVSHANQGAVYLDAIKVVCDSVGSDDPNDYLTSASSIAMIEGKEVVSGGNETSIVFGDKFNADTVLSSENPVTAGDISLVAQKGTGSNDPKYFKNGAELRFYGKNTMTISSTGSDNISKVVFTCTQGDIGLIDADAGSFSAGVWTGSSSSITFTNTSTSQVRFTAVKVITGSSQMTVESVALRFGVSIPKADWNAIENNSDWPINEFGVMLFKTRQASVPTVEEVFNATPAKTIAINNAQYGVALEEDGNNYSFSVKVNISGAASYDIYFCAAPYIVIDGDYYFLDNMKYSVQSLATYYLSHSGSSLSTDALNVLAGN